MATKVVTGITRFTIDGLPYDLVGEASYSLNTIKRETMIGMDGPHGVKEMPVIGELNVTVRDSSGLSVADFGAMVGVQVVLHLGNSKSILANDAYSVDVQEVDAAEATIKLKFNSADISEIG